MRKNLIFIVMALIGISAIAAAVLLYNGVILFNNPPRGRYPVRGVDVSSYQGEIDWDVLAGQGIDFAFIKATEGSTFQDSRFAYNWENAGKTDLRIGAYHFFSFESPGETQAENFIRTVPMTDGMLPPVVDIEFYGDEENNSAQQEKVQGILTEILTGMEDHYGVKPIIYATRDTYERYIENAYPEYDIWVRSVWTRPRIPDSEWTFWQYTNREQLKGYCGDEKYIDMNVFSGTRDAFGRYALSCDRE
jgi:lysozyme